MSANANNSLPVIPQGTSYNEAKISLIANGWRPIENRMIEKSSLYAQELYEQGTLEVVDCISMELDACWFHYKKNKQILEVKTITRQLKVERINVMRGR
jgi:hypothetical protein